MIGKIKKRNFYSSSTWEVVNDGGKELTGLKEQGKCNTGSKTLTDT